MTKKEFINALKDMPDDSEIYFWDFNRDAWRTAIPYYFNNSYEVSTNNKLIGNFIGIE